MAHLALIYVVILLVALTAPVIAKYSNTSASCDGCFVVFDVWHALLVKRENNSDVSSYSEGNRPTVTWDFLYAQYTLDTSGILTAHPAPFNPKQNGIYDDLDFAPSAVRSEVLQETPTVLGVLYNTIENYYSVQIQTADGVCITQSSALETNTLSQFSDPNFSHSPNQTTYALSSFPSLQAQIGSFACSQMTTPTAAFTETPNTSSYAESLSVSPSLSHSLRLGVGIIIAVFLSVMLGLLIFFIYLKRCEVQKTRTGRVEAWMSLPIDNKDHDSIGFKHTFSFSKLIASEILSKKSWRAPLLILGGLLGGLVFTLGHHYFYQSISGHPTDDLTISQSWIFRLGNFFAFAVKLFLSLSLGTSFIQLQWLKLRCHTLTIRNIDRMFSIESNLFEFASRIWFHYPDLAIIAMLFWLLPLIPIVTPGTLNVIMSPHQQDLSLQVPQLDFASAAWGDTDEGDYGHFNPTMSQSVLASAFAGKIISMTPQYANQSYHMEFYAPGINCYNANESYTRETTMGLGNGYNYRNYTLDRLLYYAWTPNYSDIDVVSEDAARIFIASTDPQSTDSTVEVDGQEIRVANLTECALHNTFYSLDIVFQNAEQTVFSDVTFLEGISLSDTNTADSNDISAVALTSSLNSLLLGSLTTSFSSQSYSVAAQTGISITNSIGYLHFDYMDPQSTQRGIEEIFRNMTLSLLATDYSSGFINHTTVVATVTNYLATYSYNPSDLFLTYSLALLLALGCSFIGLYAFFVSGNSYQNIFSSFVRIAKDLDLPIRDHDNGADPLPHDLASTTVSIGQAYKRRTHRIDRSS